MTVNFKAKYVFDHVWDRKNFITKNKINENHWKKKRWGNKKWVGEQGKESGTKFLMGGRGGQG